MNILWTLTGPWKHHRWQRMFLDLSKHYEVNNIYVIERSYDILTYPLRGWTKKLTPPIPLSLPVNPKLTIVRYPMLYPERFDHMKLLTKWLLPVISHLKPDIAILSSPLHIPWALSIKKSGGKVIYFVYDEILYTEDGNPRKDTLQFEKQMARIADAIVVTSPTLIPPRQKYNKPIFIRPNGTDTTLWKGPHQEPDFLKEIPYPRIIFHGHMGPWIDEELFAYIAKNIPDAHFIVIGKIQGKAQAILKQISNVHILPFRPQEEVAAAVYHSDIAFMPFKTKNHFSRAINPLKLYEALSAGIPVVISDLPSVPNGKGIYKYHSKEEVLNIIKDVLNRPPARKDLQQFAEQWDWHNINKKMLRIIGGIGGG